MDIVGLFPTRATQKKFLLVAIDYFNKWVEAEAYACIKDKDVSKFVWKNFICRFEIPRAFVTDNGSRFDNTMFRTFCSKLNIKNLYSTPCYPQNNRQANVTNKTLLNALKKMLEWAKGKLVDKLLWAYQTTSRLPMRSTPFALAYRMEVIIPTEIGMPTTKTTVQDQRDNDEELIRQLDWNDEKNRSYSYPDSFLPSKSSHSVQQKGTTTVFPTKIFGSHKSLQKHSWSRSPKATS